MNRLSVFIVGLCAALVGCGVSTGPQTLKNSFNNPTTPGGGQTSSGGGSPSTGSVQVAAPTGTLFLSRIHYAATATTTCPKGIASMGIYSSPGKLAYQVNGGKLDTMISLPPGTYGTTVQAQDNCGGSFQQPVNVTVQSTTTTLTAQTSNNTSTADTFQTWSDGDEGATNVSKVDIHSQLYPGSNTEIYAELQPWFGDPRHLQVGYISWDPNQVEKQLEDMQSRGATGVVIDWYGPADRTEPTTLAWLAAAPKHPGFKVMIMIDKGAIQLSPCNGCDPQQTLIYLTNYILQNYATSPSYATLNGNPLITQFDIDLHYSIDWNAVQQATSPNIAWIFENAGGFTHPVTSGSWSWVNISPDYGFGYLTNFYNTAAQYPQEMAWGAAYKGFNDSLASWGQHRIIDQQCGVTWLETLQMINTYYNSGNQLPILQLVTWNDYEEGTEIESGIDNCLSISAGMNGSKLQWNIQGNEQTVDHYVVYVTADGQNLLALDTMPVGSRGLDLSQFNLGAGNYAAYVQAVGKPTIKNQMSGEVNFTR